MTNDSGPHGLSFQPKLFANASQKKAVAISELYKQLKKLSKELNGLEQETVDTQSLDAVTRQLLAPSLLRHKESGVVSYVSCCIADILRLYAPEAPYSDDEIKDIFNVFIDQLQLLSDTDNQFFALREYLLTSLATVRTPALVAMQPDAEDTISRFFTTLFGVVSPGQPHSIQMQILDVLQQLVEEPKTVPQDVVDVILLQFTKRRQQENPAAHQIASDLANNAADILQKYIYQYFNDVIVSAAQQRAGSMEDQEDTGSLDDLRSAHYLILELNKAAPGTLLNVIPQLEEELSVEDVDIRVLSTNVLGEMFGEKGFTLAKRYETTWKAWVGRRADASPLVRTQWVERAVALYQHQPQLARELNAYVAEKLCDVDERVRMAACHSLGLLEMGTAVQNVLGDDVVAALGERCKDRRAGVRAEAIVSLATVYSQVVEQLEQSNAARLKWGGIPSTIFVLRYVNDPDIDSKVESILTGAILNFAKIKDDRAKCRRLLLVFDSLTAKAQNGFFSYMRRQRDIIRLTSLFLTQCMQEDSASVEQQQRELAAKISTCFPDRAKMEAALAQLAALQDAEVYRGLQQTMDANSDIKTVRKCQKGALKRLSSLAPNLLDTTAPLWKCVGLTTINRVLIPYLIEHASTGSQVGQFHRAADKLLVFIADVFPEMLELSKDSLFDIDELSSREPSAIEERLGLMVRFAKAASNSVPKSTALENRLAALVRSGTVIQAKRAAFLLTQMPGAASLCAALTGDVVDTLDNTHLAQRAPAFAALSRFALHAPSGFATYADRVSQFLVQTILVNGDMDYADGDADWISRSSLDDTGLMQVYSVKILAHWLIGMDRKSLSRDLVQLVMGTLRQLVRNGGTMQPRSPMAGRSAAAQHIELVAASSLIKIAKHAHLDRLINATDIQSLGLIVQDACYEVRSSFLLNKLVPALAARQIHARFIPLVFLVAHEVEPDVREHVRHAVEQRLAQFRPTPGSPSLVESSLVRLIHLLAHHPDWDDSSLDSTLSLFAPYLEFYITCVCKSQNVSLLFCLAGELKTVRNRAQADGITRGVTNEQFTTRIYVLGELAQYLVREKSLAANWPLNVYPGQLALPDDLFEPLSDAEKAAMPRKPFLDPAFVAARSKSSASAAGGNKRSRTATAKSKTKQVAQTPKKPRSRKSLKGKEPAAGDSSDAMDVEDVEMSDGDSSE
ncbi:Sister chromatid cohesion protein pds5 [Coemansia sp. RSA 989]|nr:Sister chromatid cohesion protein pds5 [Coemansia sp. RSA 1086]KAJ1748506.1 Sister chromatid cohesion protein pds5 [Coemansia sp. RSA 1821]KAJ1862644.1 Sister chromatid cohesion protein pds5 [Coemansia sp. RSA 989]KAJ1870503.1 Sister chromatid cohesion protein pds5 [Coemansia sp. RSA 990]